MFRREGYERSQGYGAIPLSVVDDVSVAAVVEKENAKGDFVWGQGYVEVDWYKTPLELLKGTRKHLFAGMDFNLITVGLISIVAFLFYIFPVLGVFITEGYTQVLFIGAIFVRLLMFQWQSFRVGGNFYMPVYALLTYPFTIISIWYSVFHVIRQGGVEWLGKLYTIEELKSTSSAPLKED